MLKFSNILDATIVLSTCLQAVITKGSCLTISLSCFSPQKLVCVCFGLATQSSIIIKSGGCSKNYKILYGLFVLWAGMTFVVSCYDIHSKLFVERSITIIYLVY